MREICATPRRPVHSWVMRGTRALGAARLIVVLLAFSPDSSAGAPKPVRSIYFVDVRRALLSTATGKVLAEELAREQERTHRDLSAREQALGELERDYLREPTKAKIAEYDRHTEQLETALLSAEERVLELEMKRVLPLANDVRGVIADLNHTHKNILLLELGDYVPLNQNKLCDATDWLVGRLEKPGKKILPKHPECSARFFLYADVEKLKAGMKSSAAALDELEQIRERRLQEIVLTSTATPLTRFQLYRRYTEEEDARKIRERKLHEAMNRRATDLIQRTGAAMNGVLFLASRPVDKLAPSCEVTSWLIQLANGTATIDDVALDCPCVWLGPKGGKLRVTRGCAE